MLLHAVGLYVKSEVLLIVIVRIIVESRSTQPGHPSVGIGAMSTSESWDVNRHTARCTSPVSVVWQCKLVSG